MNSTGQSRRKGTLATAAAVEALRRQPISAPVDHGSRCCAAARQWLGAIHAAGGATSALEGLAWIAETYPWGASRWPMSWCELVEQDTLDCGAQAAVAREVLCGYDVYGAQLLLRATASEIEHWRCSWATAGVFPTWLFDGFYYHEAIAVAGHSLEVFDPTRNSKISPSEGREQDALLAIRVSGGSTRKLRWSSHQLVAGEWAFLRTEA